MIATTFSRHHCHAFEHARNEQKLALVLVLVLVLVFVLESKARQLRMRRILVLWVVELTYRGGGNKSILCGAFSGFFPVLPASLLSTLCQCDGCLSSQRRGGSWLGCQVLPAIGAVSILELAANRRGSRMCQAPNFHLATPL